MSTSYFSTCPFARDNAYALGRADRCTESAADALGLALAFCKGMLPSEARSYMPSFLGILNRNSMGKHLPEGQGHTLEYLDKGKPFYDVPNCHFPFPHGYMMSFTKPVMRIFASAIGISIFQPIFISWSYRYLGTVALIQ